MTVELVVLNVPADGCRDILANRVALPVALTDEAGREFTGRTHEPVNPICDSGNNAFQFYPINGPAGPWVYCQAKGAH